MSAHTKKSDTHDERYVHVLVDGMLANKATVFARQERGLWWASVAFCSREDTFSKKRGRTVARRKWFDLEHVPVDNPEYDTLKSLAETLAP